MIRVSKSAIEKLRESNESTQKNLFRIFISGIGCGGPQMGMALDELKANDEKIEVEGFTFIMASQVVDTIRPHGNLFCRLH